MISNEWIPAFNEFPKKHFFQVEGSMTDKSALNEEVAALRSEIINQPDLDAVAKFIGSFLSSSLPESKVCMTNDPLMIQS